MENVTEIIGYVATVILVLSFLPRKIKYIRAINLVACIAFVLYGVLLGNKWPIILSNGIIVLIQLYYLMGNKPSESNS